MKLIATAGIAGAVLCLAAPPLQAAEGILVVERTVNGTNTRTSQVQIEPQRMRAEMTGPAGDTQVIVFDGPQQVLRIISVDRKSYTELTKADADRMGSQVTSAMAAMKEKMAGMPPEQRAKMEAMMARLGGAIPGLGAAKPDYRRAGTDTVGKWTCDKYEGFRNGEKVSEICTVEPQALGLTPADFEISKQVAEFFQTLLPQGADQIVGVGTLEAQGFSGIPVRRVRISGGTAQSTSELTEVRRQTFPDSSYDVPAGFEKQAVGRR